GNGPRCFEPTPIEPLQWPPTAKAAGGRRSPTPIPVWLANLLVEAARRKQRAKHAGGRSRIDLDAAEPAGPHPPEDLVALDAALPRLASVDPQAAKLGSSVTSPGCPSRKRRRPWASPRAAPAVLGLLPGLPAPRACWHGGQSGIVKKPGVISLQRRIVHRNR